MKVDLLPKIQIEMVVNSEKVDHLVSTIMQSARTGIVGDGHIFVIPVEKAIRIRTGETREESPVGGRFGLPMQSATELSVTGE